MLLLLNATPREIAAGAVAGVIGIGQGITEVTAETANYELRVSEALQVLGHAGAVRGLSTDAMHRGRQGATQRRPPLTAGGALRAAPRRLQLPDARATRRSLGSEPQHVDPSRG